MREHLRIYGLGLLLVIAGFILAYQFVKPSPPRSITIATGSESGAYYAFAQQYKALLAKEGIELTILNTQGSIENLSLLQSGKVDIAFVQSGTGRDFAKASANTVSGSDQAFVSLASLYYEPLWLFMPASKTAFKATDLQGQRVSIGTEGSGTRALAEVLLSNNAVDTSNTTLLGLESDLAAQQLVSGELDYVFLVASVTAPIVNSLLSNAEIVPFDFQRAKAYTRRYRFLSAVELPQGVVDFSQNIPSKDTELLSAAATLVTQEDLHPALVALLMQAIDSVHKEGGLLEEAGQFPSELYVDFPLHRSAKNYFDYGPPLLQRYLPFWAAVLVNQLKVFLIPILALMIPLSRILPPLYRWRVRSHIYRWYRHLREIEEKIADHSVEGNSLSDEENASLQAELEALQQDVIQQTAPLSYTDELYHLQSHIKLVKERLEYPINKAE